MSEIVERVADLMAPVGSGIVVPTEALPSNLQKSYWYWYLLSLCDGGTVNCFFHFFGRVGPSEHNLLGWNRPPLWKHHYNLGEQSFVFAEDIWGTQFYFDIRGNRRVVKMLIPDGGRTTVCANTFEEFLENEVLSTGFNKRPRFLAERFFHERHVAFRPFTHISCKVPGMLGGSDEDLANLTLSNSASNLSLLGQVHSQIKGLAPGTRIIEVRVAENGSVTLITG